MAQVTILVGLPGSGKSTEALTNFKTFTRINQDQLGSRGKCLEVMRQCLENNQDVVIDRVNHTKKQRNYFIETALLYGASRITCIYLDCSPDECVSRIHLRKGHETIKEEMSYEEKLRIVYSFFHEMELPELSEGFNEILFKRN